MALNVTAADFEEVVLKAKEPVLVDFWATWCGPCQEMLPIVEELSQEREDIKVCKVNVDEEASLARKYHVMSIPTFLIFENGELKNRTVGAVPKERLLELLGK